MSSALVKLAFNGLTHSVHAYQRQKVQTDVYCIIRKSIDDFVSCNTVLFIGYSVYRSHGIQFIHVLELSGQVLPKKKSI